MTDQERTIPVSPSGNVSMSRENECSFTVADSSDTYYIFSGQKTADGNR